MIILYLPPITRRIEEDVADLLFIPGILLYLFIDFLISLVLSSDDEEE